MMKKRRARGERFDEAARRVAGRGAGARDDNTEAAAHAREGVRHARGPGLAPRRNEADFAAAIDGIEDRHVVNRYHAERCFYAAILQKPRDEIAHVHQAASR